MSPSNEVREGLVEAIPNLRAFAMSLCGRSAWADDLVQETLVRAWAKADSYRDGTNLMAWLFTILRNEFYSQLRKRKREVEDIDGAQAAQLTAEPAQLPHLEVRDFKAALALLPEDQREAIVLIGASGFSYDEAADIMGCAIGTVKSRLSRARTRLAEILDGNELNETPEVAAE
ncbi:UNVERIFIED_CONTAM: hypothetical protein GTU68_067109 [Idotea baltica]|nr:hypothetical protein [Idotea baltica]